MNNKDINAILSEFASLDWHLQEAFEENGGEITPELEAQLDQQENLRALLEGDGIDALGRWLKSVQDRATALKAEKDSIARQIQACDKTVNYIREQIRKVLDTIGTDKAKGTCYSFTASDSWKVEADKALLKELYQAKALAAIHAAGIPEYVGVSLTASSTAVPEGEQLPEIFTVTESKTVTFRKPKATKDQEAN